MTIVSAIRSRTLSRLFSSRLQAVVASLLWAAQAALFFFFFRNAQYCVSEMAHSWVCSCALVLPFAAAFFGMGVVSSEYDSGRMDLYLTSAAKEGQIISGKFAAVWLVMSMWLAACLFLTCLSCNLFSPLRESVSAVRLLPSLLALLFQSVVFAAASVMFSSFTRHVAVACAASILTTSVLPRLSWHVAGKFLSAWRYRLGEFPLDAHVSDMASGVFSATSVACYAVLAALFLFVASKRLSLQRMVGAGGRRSRFGTVCAMLSAVVFAVSLTVLFSNFSLVVKVPVGSSNIEFSKQALEVISETRGVVNVTCFMLKNSPSYGKVLQYMRSIERSAEAHGGGRFTFTYVDPAWDVSSAQRLVRDSLQPPCILFESSHRRAVLSLENGINERYLISAIKQLTSASARRVVYWTKGHGEILFDDYSSNGMSDIARFLRADGYENAFIDLAGEESIPLDCAVVVVSGARDVFSRQESSKLDKYLHQGGRLLVLTSSVEGKGVDALLPKWGIRARKADTAADRTLTGTDVIADRFARHPITSAMEGSQIVLDRPVGFTPSAAVTATASADGIEFTSLVRSAGETVVASSVRGASARDDLSIRPTRIVVIGDESFATNSQLKSRANGNRDLFVNSVAFLAGADSFYGGEDGAGTTAVKLDYKEQKSYFLTSVAVVPGAALCLLFIGISWRRRK